MQAVPFQVGMEVSTKEVLKKAIKEHILKGLYSVEMVKNDKRQAGCKWKLHAYVIFGDLTLFQGITFISDQRYYIIRKLFRFQSISATFFFLAFDFVLNFTILNRV